jgi:phosphatidylglycerophosphate synthase
VRHRRFAPLWVYFFGLFALAFLQRFAFPPDEHSVAANVAFFVIGAVVVFVVITIAQYFVYRR